MTSKAFILAHGNQLNLAEQERFLRLLQHAMHISTLPGLQFVNANGGIWHHKKDKQDRIPLSEVHLSRSPWALELASYELADAWGMREGSSANVNCFRKLLL